MFDFDKIRQECVKCGKCIPVCTIHQINPDEATSPRGFIELLGSYQEGELPLDKTTKAIFESCFLCTNCVDVCPNKLPTDLVIENVRADIAKKYGIAWYKRAFFLLLRHRWLMDILAKLGYVFKSCGFKNHDDKNSMQPYFDVPLLKADRLLPSVAKTSFLNRYPENMTTQTANRRVAIFIGCMANYSYVGVGEALVDTLKALDINILIPKKQMCCGAPSYFTGDFQTTTSLIKHNISYFESFIDDVEAILVPEATCSSMIIHDWIRVLKDEPQWCERAEKIIAKTHIATAWLERSTHLNELLAQKKISSLTLTYHDPCHSRKTQGIWREPRRLLSHNHRIIEMSDSNRCCGFGGVTMQSEKFHLAQMAGQPKATMIQETQAHIVVAECSACRVQLTNALYQNGVNVVFKNPIELVAKTLKDS